MLVTCFVLSPGLCCGGREERQLSRLVRHFSGVELLLYRAQSSSRQVGESCPPVLLSLEHAATVKSFNFVVLNYYKIRSKLSSSLTVTPNITGFQLWL